MNMQRHVFTPHEIAQIRDLYPNHTNREIARILGCSVYSINNRAHAMGLKKPASFVLQTKRSLGENLVKSGARHRFPKGHIPANKGKKMSQEQYQRSARTMFRKGNLPANTLHDGAETVRFDKRGKPYTFLRLSLSKWVHKHIWIWEQKHGKVPSGKILYCKDGNTLNCDPDNWEPVTRAESMARCRQSDEYAAMQIAGRNKEIQQLILEEHPELIELKRMANQLKQNINECT